MKLSPPNGASRRPKPLSPPRRSQNSSCTTQVGHRCLFSPPNVGSPRWAIVINSAAADDAAASMDEVKSAFGRVVFPEEHGRE